MTAVTVLAPYQVSPDGKVYGPGSVVEAPGETAREWYSFGWVEKAKLEPKPPPRQAVKRGR